ncbi:hypothetical protein acsn021_21030 [Anaerocolumna cellulosilytica]|uniref:Uncharacterized protein n=1 Tax=Anaerocolumna cellulosilytica TaxID=433286 RepID=A0A6S6QV90_9FIRM|nr:hypothetical protein [Anaerocolumna cellulosilytica]MBB5194253.1 hypothetical protein [Anaerocolumna cellulosilytica]BCJ94534.1 hypothetical protein acsn021_21030 [Anaerocolumna cellulosilytica]
MLKLMKYEFRKQALSKLVILSIIAFLEVMFVIGVLLENENTMATSMGFLGVLTIGAMFFLAFESIITYSNDLKQKCSYMLFLTPNSSYSIVGAKVVSAAIQVFVSGIAFVAIYAINGTILVAKFASIAEVKDLILEFFRAVIKIDVDMSAILLVVAVILLFWINTITVAFFSITLSTTFLAEKKFKGVVSFILFFFINYVYGKITDLVLNDRVNLMVHRETNIYLFLNILFLLCFTIITYVGTAWMLEKKVSV